MKLNSYLCTSKLDQVQILANSEQEAIIKFRQLHETPDDEVIEIVNLTNWKR